MKKRCEHWRENESVAGAIAYCEIAAFNRKTEAGYLEQIGCTAAKREECRKMMVRATGFGLVPEAETGNTAPAERTAVAEHAKGVETMKKMVECRNWTEYESMGGAIMFCSAAAYGKKMTRAREKECGCTMLKREKCLEMMVKANGYGLVPEVATEGIGVERKELVKMAG